MLNAGGKQEKKKKKQGKKEKKHIKHAAHNIGQCKNWTFGGRPCSHIDTHTPPPTNTMRLGTDSGAAGPGGIENRE